MSNQPQQETQKPTAPVAPVQPAAPIAPAQPVAPIAPAQPAALAQPVAPAQPSPHICAPAWTNAHIGSVSLTELEGLPGAPEPVNDCGSTFHGAKFMKVKYMYTPYYERLVSEIVPVPWIAEPEEATFMNRQKAANEPPVQTYAQLQLSAIPADNYETVEGFGQGGYDLFFKVLLVLLLLAFVYYIVREMK